MSTQLENMVALQAITMEMVALQDSMIDAQNNLNEAIVRALPVEKQGECWVYMLQLKVSREKVLGLSMKTNAISKAMITTQGEQS